jgi:hypothetical protein
MPPLASALGARQYANRKEAGKCKQRDEEDVFQSHGFQDEFYLLMNTLQVGGTPKGRKRANEVRNSSLSRALPAGL